MKIATKVLLVVSTLLFAVDLSGAQLCNEGTAFQCMDDFKYLPCTPTGPDYSKNLIPCDTTGVTAPEYKACHGNGATTDICVTVSCEKGIGNHKLPGDSTNLYYTCAGTENNGKGAYIGVGECPSSDYDEGARNCAPPTTTPAASTTPASSTSNPTTSAAPPTGAPTCSGQSRQPDPTSCNHFYVCAGARSGPGTRTKCPFRMRYDVATSKCRIRLLTNCGNRPETS